MLNKKDHELDVANLKMMQNAGKLNADVDVQKFADAVAKWRKSDNAYDKALLAEYGRDEDLDELVRSDDCTVRATVAYRKRNKDLDILVHDSNSGVREAVAIVGRKEDLEILENDSNMYVRQTVEKVKALSK